MGLYNSRAALRFFSAKEFAVDLVISEQKVIAKVRCCSTSVDIIWYYT
jgi:hypothetical protein